MLSFIRANLGNILVLLMLAVIVGWAVRSLISQKRKGKTSCGCGCESCPSAGVCHGKKKSDR